MKLFADHDIRRLFRVLSAVMGTFLLLSQLALLLTYGGFSPLLSALFFLMAGCTLTACFLYVRGQDRIMRAAVSQIQALLSGDARARIDCDKEGELYRLFHSVNNLAAVLNAHAANELREKEFLKEIISDISHQLKTPLAALRIYHELIREEAEEPPSVREFAALSERELERIETLIQSLLKIARWDAGAVALEMTSENVADMMKDTALRFACRAERERKELTLSGDSTVRLFCDRDWIMEAVGNIVKNALDHTKEGDSIRIEWRRFASIVQLSVRDSGSGIHPEDLPHIFKRFYRSRFATDTQGIGLGLPLAKAIVEAHHGAMEADSQPGQGTSFVLHFLNPTE